jgi:lipoyl(octanoyl) transferase
MSTAPFETEPQSPAVETFLLGRIEFERCLELQRRLIFEIGGRDDGQIVLLLCEHPPLITVGRGGSPGEIAPDSRLLRSGQIEVRWVNRGGGCLVHCPGQLAVYPIVPLRWHGFSVGEHLERLQAGMVRTLDELGVRGHTPPGQRGIWGRTGQLAAVGVAVRNWVTYYGAYLNVCPPLGLFRLVETDPVGQTRMSCLVAERRGPVRMATVRAALVRHLTEALGCHRYHLYTGHPLLRGDWGCRADRGETGRAPRGRSG